MDRSRPSSALVTCAARRNVWRRSIEQDMGVRRECRQSRRGCGGVRRPQRVTCGRNSLVWNVVHGSLVSRSRYCLSSEIVWSQSACAPIPTLPLEFTESSSSKSTIIWSSVDWRLRSGLTFIAASTAALRVLLGLIPRRTDARTKRRTRSGLVLIRSAGASRSSCRRCWRHGRHSAARAARRPCT